MHFPPGCIHTDEGSNGKIAEALALDQVNEYQQGNYEMAMRVLFYIF